MNNYSHLTITQQKALDTRARRQAAGKYPTAAQRAASAKSVGPDRANMTTAEWALLATHPYYTASQRSGFLQKAMQDA